MSISILSSFARPAPTANYYLVDAIDLKGGAREVADTTARDAILSTHRRQGMIVYCLGNNTYYGLIGGVTNSDWLALNLAGSSYTAGTGISISGSTISIDQAADLSWTGDHAFAGGFGVTADDLISVTSPSTISILSTATGLSPGSVTIGAKSSSVLVDGSGITASSNSDIQIDAASDIFINAQSDVEIRAANGAGTLSIVTTSTQHTTSTGGGVPYFLHNQTGMTIKVPISITSGATLNSITIAQLGYLTGITSDVQAQIDAITSIDTGFLTLAGKSGGQIAYGSSDGTGALRFQGTSSSIAGLLTIPREGLDTDGFATDGTTPDPIYITGANGGAGDFTGSGLLAGNGSSIAITSGAPGASGQAVTTVSGDINIQVGQVDVLSTGYRPGSIYIGTDQAQVITHIGKLELDTFLELGSLEFWSGGIRNQTDSDGIFLTTYNPGNGNIVLSTSSIVPSSIVLNSLDIQLNGPVTLGGTIAGASATEIGYLIGVSSGIQAQLNAKLVKASNLSDLTNAGTARTNLGLGSVENTALSTWAGSTNITTLGTVTTGTWSGTVISIAKGGTNSAAALSNNRVMVSSGSAIVEGAAITASRALVSDTNGIPTQSTVTTTELGYVSGVTSAIQTQLGLKAPLASPTFTGTVTTAAITATGGALSFTGNAASSLTTSSGALTLTSAAAATWSTAAGALTITSAADCTWSSLGYLILNGNGSTGDGLFLQVGGTTVLYCENQSGFNSRPGVLIGTGTSNMVRVDTTTGTPNVSIVSAGSSSWNVTSGDLTYDAGGTGIIRFGPTNATELQLSRSAGKIGFFGTAGSTRTAVAAVTNNVTSGGTSDQIDNWTDLTLYSNDAAAIRNAIYQLARKLKQIGDDLRTKGFHS